jgi:hypothetical protein
MTGPNCDKILQEVKQGLNELSNRIDDLENERDSIKAIPMAVGELKGIVEATRDQVNTLMRSMTGRFDNVDSGIERATPGWEWWLKFCIGVIVPLLLAIISGYFLLRAGVQSNGK